MFAKALRKFAIGIVHMSCLCILAMGTSLAQEGPPYVQLKPVDSEWQTVRMYYITTCPYSRAFLPFFRNLAQTGSAKTRLQFEITPIANKADGQLYFLTFAAVRRFYPQKVWDFVDASIKGRQDQGLNLFSPVDVSKVLLAANITPSQIKDLMTKNMGTLKKDARYLEQIQSAYFLGKDSEKLAVTPSIVIAGTYITNPNLVKGGSSENFSNSVNALISMVAGPQSLPSSNNLGTR